MKPELSESSRNVLPERTIVLMEEGGFRPVWFQMGKEQKIQQSEPI
jgi:hypothetical protein